MPALLAAGVRPRACWDLGAVHRLLHGSPRNDPAAAWVADQEFPEPAQPQPQPQPAELTLLELLTDDVGAEQPVRPDGTLSPEWAREPWSAGGRDDALQRAARWAALALQVQACQAARLAELPDPRPSPGPPVLALLTAHAESCAALLAVELEHIGLRIDRSEAERLLGAAIGPRPVDPRTEQEARHARDADVLRHFPATGDLRNPAQVRRCSPRSASSSSPAVAALLQWRRVVRLATTYGWAWLDRHVARTAPSTWTATVHR